MAKKTKDFKLLAIRPRKGCSSKYCNNLQKGEIYSLYSFYEFETNSDGKVINITEKGNDHGLFNLFNIRNEGHPRISVSAIVGKNGSGKSTLVDLFYITGYLVAKRRGLLDNDPDLYPRRREEEELAQIEKGLKVEVYYKADEKYGCLVIDQKFEKPVDQTKIEFIDVLGGDNFRLSDLFYTVVINYSIYGLNERVSGAWVGRLFHKNDGYQTPIVINPYRNHGTIDVNNELHFAQTRLLSNLMYTRGEIIPGKQVTGILFTYNIAKSTNIGRHRFVDIKNRLEKTTGKSIEEIFRQVYVALLDEEPTADSIQNPRWRPWIIRYVIRKLIRIASNYPDYQEFFQTSPDNLPEIKRLDDFIEALKIDKTHITLKLRQALNFYRYDPLRESEHVTESGRYQVYVPIEIFASRLSESIRLNPDNDPAEFVPIVPFAQLVIMDSKTEFNRLSSGEQQYIHSIQAIAYHILNLNSVFKSPGNRPKAMYERVNIILDEIELYFHPEYQRRFLKDLLEYIGDLHLPNIKAINILFLTHSPFILSDIPATNVMRIKNGHLEKERPLTLAGNIHEMLAGSFFMEATTGELARLYCQQIIAFYERVRNSPPVSFKMLQNEYYAQREKYRYIVSQIGEDIIRGILQNHLRYLDERLGVIDQNTAQRLQDLQQQLDAIQKQIDDASN